jgi:hypothetical protein
MDAESVAMAIVARLRRLVPSLHRQLCSHCLQLR